MLKKEKEMPDSPKALAAYKGKLWGCCLATAPTECERLYMKKNNKGFSLVELIVVIAIMAILAAVAVVSYSVYIERAQDAKDQQYIDNILYFSELFAIENQLPLEWVEIVPEVDGAEDIKLICKDSEGNLYQYTGDISEIFNAVGPGYIEGGLNNGKYQPGQGGGSNEPDDGIGQTPCNCNNNNYKEVEKQDATCDQDGWIVYECQNEGCGEKWQEILTAEHDFHKLNEKYEVCKKCGTIRGGVVVPID